MKLLLQHPANVRDLLTMAADRWARWIDFDRMRLVPTTFVQRDYRHIEADVVLVAPLRRSVAAPAAKKLLIYLLIEHQSKPDRVMPLRLLDCVLQIFKFQVREWTKKHAALSHVCLGPVLPIVFYTGTRRWDSISEIVHLIENGGPFAEVTPMHRPIFINLSRIPLPTLEAKAGSFGWLLRLLQRRAARPDAFRRLLGRAIRSLESLSANDRLRWLELLSYIHAMIYRERAPSEHAHLRTTVEKSVHKGRHQEISTMGKTIADMFKEEGEVRGRRHTLLRVLRARFGDLPEDVVKTVEATEDLATFDDWMDRILTAETLKEMRIRSS